MHLQTGMYISIHMDKSKDVFLSVDIGVCVKGNNACMCAICYVLKSIYIIISVWSASASFWMCMQVYWVYPYISTNHKLVSLTLSLESIDLSFLLPSEFGFDYLIPITDIHILHKFLLLM